MENIEFAVAELTGVDQVKDLHHYERLEDHRVQLALSSRPVISVSQDCLVRQFEQHWVLAVHVFFCPELSHEEWLVLVVLLQVEEVNT